MTELPLTVREFDILFRMLSYPRKTFTRSALMEAFWDYDSSATSRTVKKLPSDFDIFVLLTLM